MTTNETETFNLIPTWKAAAQIFMAALENGTFEGQKAGRAGIMDMADRLDRLVQQQKDAAKEAEIEETGHVF